MRCRTASDAAAREIQVCITATSHCTHGFSTICLMFTRQHLNICCAKEPTGSPLPIYRKRGRCSAAAAKKSDLAVRQTPYGKSHTWTPGFRASINVTYRTRSCKPPPRVKLGLLLRDSRLSASSKKLTVYIILKPSPLARKRRASKNVDARLTRVKLEKLLREQLSKVDARLQYKIPIDARVRPRGNIKIEGL